MRNLLFIAGTTLALVASNAALSADTAQTHDAPDSLFSAISKLDEGLFDSFNHCASAGELQRHAGYLDPDLEFYHDKGGVTWSRQAYLANTKQNVCGKFRRHLILGSLQVFPLKDYGAIEQGSHKFCYIESGQCFGEAQFLVIWHHLKDGDWQATRIVSYGHQAT